MRAQCRWQGMAAGQADSHPAPCLGRTRADARSRAHRWPNLDPFRAVGAHECGKVFVHFRGHDVHGSYESHHPAATAVVVRSAPARVLVLSGVAVISSRSPLPPGQSPIAGPPVFVWYTFVCAPSAGPASSLPPDTRVETRRAGKGCALEKMRRGEESRGSRGPVRCCDARGCGSV